MASDIILDEESIRIEGPMVDVHGHTLVLDFILPRDAALNTDDLRRPLVHDAGDSLTINWGQKYTGGVTIFGDVSIPGRLAVASELSVPGHLRVNLPESILPEPDPERGRTVGGIRGLYLSLSATPVHVDVGPQLRMLRELVKDLNERLSALESR